MRSLTWYAGSVALAVALPVYGLEYSFNPGYKARYTDNVQLVARDPQDDVVHRFLVAGRVASRTPNLDLSARGAIEGEYWQNDTFEPRVTETLNLAAVYAFVPDRFFWTIDDSLELDTINALLPATPANQEQTNRVSTGPDFIFRSSTRNSLHASLRYENTAFETSALSNERGLGEARWIYQVTEPIAFLLRYRYENVRYREGQPGTNYAQDSLTAGFEGKIGLTSTYRFEIGPGRIRQDLQPEFDSRVGTAHFRRSIRQDSGFEISLISDLRDSGESATAAGGGLNPGQADVSHAREGHVDYFGALRFLKYNISGLAREEDFRVSDLDVREYGASVRFEHEFSSRLTSYLGAKLIDSDYVTILRLDRSATGTAGLEYRLRTHWYLRGEIARDQRDSSDASQEYRENSVTVSLNYRFDSPFIPTSR